MTCPEIRAQVLIAEPGELTAESEIGRHLATCPACAAAVSRIRIGTAAVAEQLDGWSPSHHPALITERIQADRANAQRRWEHGWSLAGTAAIVLISLMVYVAKSERTSFLRARLGYPDLPYISSFTLNCLNPEAAAEIGRPILSRSGGSAEPYPGGGQAVVLSGRRDAVAQAEIAIKQADGSLDPEHPRACPGPAQPAPER